MGELGNSWQHMGFVQLALLFGFVLAYILALGRLLGAAGRVRAASMALLMSAAFVWCTSPWEHGALLVVFVIAALGVYVAAMWAMATLLAPRDAALEVANEGHVVAPDAVRASSLRSVVGAAETVASALH